MMKDLNVPQLGYLPETPTLSVCMIVRDEELMLPRCLNSVKAVADELIVLDTGSTDKSVSIAKDFGTKVISFEWCDDFSAARNESLKHATSDWILQLDGDETLLPSSISHLKSRMLRSKVLCYLVLCDNGPEYTGPRFCWVGRLFRNHPSIFYSRPYHESIQQSVDGLRRKEPRWEIRSVEHIVIRHYGYERNLLKAKAVRGLAIMESYIKQKPDDEYMLTKLGNAYGNQGRYGEAEACLKRAIKENPYSPEANYSLALTMKHKNELDGAMEYFQKTIAADPDFAEAYVGLGAVYLQKRRMDDALRILERAITLRPDLALAHSNLASIYWKKGNPLKAVHHCDRALELGGPIRPEILESLKPYRQST